MKKAITKTKNHFLKRKGQTKYFFKKVWEILNRPEMIVLPGQLAFFLILSLVPIITLIGYAASTINIDIKYVVELLNLSFSDEVINTIVPIISGDGLDFKLIIMLIIMFYFAANGPASIIVTADEIYGLKQTTWLKRRIKALIMTIILVLLYLFIIIVPILGEKIITAIDYFNIKSIITSILAILRGPISWIIIFIFIKIIFTLAPDKQIKSSQVNIGAVFTTIGWVISTHIYGYYVSHIARYDLFYAGLSNIAVLMLWIYLLSYILVVGLSLTIKIDKNEMEKTGSIIIEEENKI